MSTEAKTFLSKYGNGPKNRARLEPWGKGFLRLQYGCQGEIEQAAYVRKRGEKPRQDQLQLYFMLINDTVTFKSESALSGSYWSNGYVDCGTVYEDSLGAGHGKKIDLDTWINKCLKEMCLPENK